MKLCFVRPPFEGMSNYVPPHLGIACLYGYLVNHINLKIEYSLIDALADKLSVDDIVSKIIQKKPEIVALTVKTCQVEQTKEIIKKINKVYSPLLVCGGNHVSVSPKEFIDAGATYAIKGAGEKCLADLIKKEYLNVDAELQHVKYQQYKHGYIVENSSISRNIDDVGTPNWELFNLEKYNENLHYNTSIKALPIMASRGCPYHCDFCSSFLTWGFRVVYRSPKLVIREMLNAIKKYQINHFHFYDDNLLLNRRWMIEFLDLLELEHLDIKFICLSRPEIILRNKDLLSRMKMSGCLGFELGFETVDEDLYDRMNKKNNSELFKKVFKLLIEHNFLLTEFLVMCMYDGETFDSMYKTYRLLRQYKKSEQLFIYSRYFSTPFIGTKFSESISEKGVIIHPSNKYKYAIFLNFVPYSFLNSKLLNIPIDKSLFQLQWQFTNFSKWIQTEIIYKEEFSMLLKKLSPHEFIDIYEIYSQQNKTVLSIIQHISKKFPTIPYNSVIEYVCRILELIACRNSLQYNEENSNESNIYNQQEVNDE